MQQQLIQNTIGMSLNNPDVMKNLLAMLKEQLQGGSKSTSSVSFAWNLILKSGTFLYRVNHSICLIVTFILTGTHFSMNRHV